MIDHVGVFGAIAQLGAQDAVKSQDGIHGRAQFMADRCNEFVFVGLCANQGLVRHFEVGIAAVNFTDLQIVHAL